MFEKHILKHAIFTSILHVSDKILIEAFGDDSYT